MNRGDFKSWFYPYGLKFAWKEVSFDYNTKGEYQNKQYLSSMFHNAFVDYEKKAIKYRSEFGNLPTDFLNELIYDFRRVFPKNGRIEGVSYFDDLLENLIDPYKPLPPQPITKQKPEQETPKTFEDLFYNTDLVTPCIDILKELDPPLIDTEYNYIGKLKGIFCVWIDEMQRQGIVKHCSDRKILASLIPQKIKRFSIDESMFGKHQTKAENQYRVDIKTMISAIKLSQNSQQGK